VTTAKTVPCRDCRHWDGPEPGGYMGRCTYHGSWAIRTRPIQTTPPPWVALELWTEPGYTCGDASKRTPTRESA
jgi:hypothetical protein